MSDEMRSDDNGQKRGSGQGPDVMLEPRQERRFIAQGGCTRYVDFFVRVGPAPAETGADRMALRLALVLDRSGSMSGDKLRTAKAAALAILDRLSERDSVGVVVFDDQIDTIQAVSKVTPVSKAHVRAELARIEARGNTALHEGWLTGCKTIAEALDGAGGDAPARCFLLTDGLANVGITDPETIAGEAANIREKTGIGTSTFGIGDDYSEELLGPMAVAGGGQFHHLRSAGEIGTTFVRELGEMLAIAAVNVRLELEAAAGVSVEVLSAYGVATGASGTRWSVAVGDLLSLEERHVTARIAFPSSTRASEQQTLRARLVWTMKGEDLNTEWRDVVFTYADAAACDAEPFDPTVMHWVGLHLSDRSQLSSLRHSKSGHRQEAVDELRKLMAEMTVFAANDPALRAELKELEKLARDIENENLGIGEAKELYYRSQTRSSGKRDLRQP